MVVGGLPSLAAWTSTPIEDAVLLRPPDAAPTTCIRITPRITPLVGMRELAERTARAAGPIVNVSPLRRVPHVNGELAAVGELALASGHRIALGAVFAEDHLAAIAGVADATSWPMIVDAVDRLVANLALDVPPLRSRRVLFRRPAGWAACPRGLATELYHPEHPRRLAMITVLPARPHGSSQVVSALFDSVGGLTVEQSTRRELAPRDSLAGYWLEMIGRASPTGPQTVLDEIVLEDADFRYSLRLEATLALAEATRAVMRDIVGSIEPMPRSVKPDAHLAMEHWIR